MKYFDVTVLNRGEKELASVRAEYRSEAVKIAKGMFPGALVVKAVEKSAPLEDQVSELFSGLKDFTKSKIPINDKISTIRQIAVMTDAGIPIHDTLQDVADNTNNLELKEIYTKMNSDINSGNSMFDAMKPYADEFGHVALAMTNLGERTGNISESYNKLADILEDLRDNQVKFKKAIRGPLITLAAMGIAFTILIMVVVPKFKDIFSKFKAELPVPTKILLNLEWAFSNYGIYIILAIAAAIFYIKFRYKSDKKFKMKMDTLILHKRFYLINKAVFLSTMHKYNLVFAELVRSGIPVSEALDTAVDMVDNLSIKAKFLTVNANIGRGKSLAESFELTGLYENMLLQMIKAGEAGGQLDSMLNKVTHYYDMEFRDLIDNLSAYIEPIMMFFIAGLVLLMALGIFMPMWDLGKAVGK